MKDGLGSVILKEFVGLHAKIYSDLKDDDKGKRRAKSWKGRP